MKHTPNYGLKKPEQDDFYNVQDFNDNADIIDQALKALDDALATKETPAGAQAMANAAETNAKNHANSLVGTLSNLLTTAKNNVVAAINEIFGKVEDVKDVLESHKDRHASGGPDALTPADIGAAEFAWGTATLSTSWTGPNAQGYYTQVVTATGVLATDNVDVTRVVSVSDKAAAELIQEAWNQIFECIVNDNTLTFYAAEKPNVAIPIVWKVVR